MLKSSIIYFVLNEVKIAALLQDMQINNILGQFLSNTKLDKNDFKVIAAKINDLVLKHLNPVKWPQNEDTKSILLWILSQCAKGNIDIDRDAQKLIEIFTLWFKERGEIRWEVSAGSTKNPEWTKWINKKLSDLDFKDLVEAIEPFTPGGEETVRREILKHPIATGGDGVKIYRLDNPNAAGYGHNWEEVMAVAKGGPWCIKYESHSQTYTHRGHLYMITKHNKRYALLSFGNKEYKESHNIEMPSSMFKEIKKIYPAFEQLADPNDIRWKSNPTVDEQLNAVKFSIDMFKYIDNPDIKVQEYVISKKPKLILLIKNPSIELQKVAITADASILKDLPNVTDEVLKLAVQVNPESIKYIENPNEEMQYLAVKAKPASIKNIINPSKEIQRIAITGDAMLLQYISNADSEIQKLAVELKPISIQFVKDPDRDLQTIAVEANPKNISYIQKPHKDVQMYAVNKDVTTFYLFNERDDEVKKLAVEKDPESIKYIKKPSAELQMIAVKQDPKIINDLYRPDKTVIDYLKQTGYLQ